MTRSVRDKDWMVIKQNKVLHVVTALQFDLPQLLVTQTKNGLWYNSSVLKHNYLVALPPPGKDMTSSRLTEGWKPLAAENNCIHIKSPDLSFGKSTVWLVGGKQVFKEFWNSEGKIRLVSIHLWRQAVIVTWNKKVINGLRLGLFHKQVNVFIIQWWKSKGISKKGIENTFIHMMSFAPYDMGIKS